MNTTPEFMAEAAAIDDAREAAFAALRVANDRGVTVADVDAMCNAMAGLDARCEVLRRRFYPRRHKLVVALGAAMVVSPTGRRMETVWQRPREVAAFY